MSGSDDRLTPADGSRPAHDAPSDAVDAPTDAGDPAVEGLTRRDLHGRPRRTWRTWAVSTVVTVLVVVLGGTAYAAWRLNANITKLDVSAAIGTDRPTQAPEARRGRSTSCSSGPTPARAPATTPTPTATAPWAAGRTPTPTCSCTCPPTAPAATVVSIPRDSMTPAPPDCSATAPKSEWHMRQWNQNYSIGGTGCLIRTLEGNTGVFIDHYAVVDFRGFKQMVDALGGVKVCTPVAIDDAHTHLQLTPGKHTLDGRQALQYVRVRKSVGDGSDLQRIDRQQAFLSSVIQKATSTQLLLEPTKLFSFLNAATKSLTTDPEFGVGTMRDLAGSVKGIGLDKIQFVTVPNEPYAPDPNRVQWKASAEQIWSALRADRAVGAKAEEAQRHPVADGLAAHRLPRRRPGAPCVNATGVSGLARQAAKALEVQGFTGVTTGHRGHHHQRRSSSSTPASTTRTPAPSRRRSPARSSRRPAAWAPRCGSPSGRGAPDGRRGAEPARQRPAALAEHLVRARTHRVDPDPQRRHRHLLLTPPVRSAATGRSSEAWAPPAGQPLSSWRAMTMRCTWLVPS